MLDWPAFAHGLMPPLHECHVQVVVVEVHLGEPGLSIARHRELKLSLLQLLPRAPGPTDAMRWHSLQDSMPSELLAWPHSHLLFAG